MKFTILVPCYHSNKQYFWECIESIANQTYTDFECIVISSDDEITEKDLPENDNRFIYTRCEQESSGYKRNYGIKNGKGEYIVFIDSDDVVSNVFLETIVKASRGEDIILFPMTTTFENLSKIMTTGCHRESGTYYFDKFINKFIDINERNCPSWTFSGNTCKAYKISWLRDNTLLIDEEFGLIGEDKIFNLRCAFNKPSIVYFEDHYPYWWRTNESSFYQKKNKVNDLNWLPLYLNKLNELLIHTQYFYDFKLNVKKKICLFWLPNSIRKNRLSLREIKILLVRLFSSNPVLSFFDIDTSITNDNNVMHKFIYIKTTKYVNKQKWTKLSVLYKIYERITYFKSRF